MGSDTDCQSYKTSGVRGPVLMDYRFFLYLVICSFSDTLLIREVSLYSMTDLSQRSSTESHGVNMDI